MSIARKLKSRARASLMILNLIASLGASGLSGIPSAHAAPINKPLLKPSDIKFLGYYRFDRHDYLWYSYGGLALRKINGETHVFIMGDITHGTPIFEYKVPTEPPNIDIPSAPMADLYKDWGTIMQGHMLTGGDDRQALATALYWDAPHNAIWWGYGPNYAPVQHNPSIGATVLNDAAGTSTTYGPWRTEWSAQRTRDAFVKIPDSFAAAYTGGANVGVMASVHSGGAASPFGANLSAMTLPNPATTPPDNTTDVTHWTLANKGLILHDFDHPQARDANYKHSGWRDNTNGYDCRTGATLEPGTPFFGGPDKGSNDNDNVGNAVWIDLPDKHGVLFTGQLVGAPAGYEAPGDPDGQVHQWYGNAMRNDGTPDRTDCYGQDDPNWGTTGPGAHWRKQMGWIYDPNDFIDTAQGRKNLWDLQPVTTYELKKFIPTLPMRPFSGLGNAVFDPETRRLYIIGGGDTVTVPPNTRPALMVFEILSGDTSALPDTVTPSVAITGLKQSEAVSGTVQVNALAMDNAGVVGVQFRLDGANLGPEDTTMPYRTAWNTAGVPAGYHTLSAIVRDAAGNTGTADNITVQVGGGTTPPPPTCPNATCDNGETNASCPADCPIAPPPPPPPPPVLSGSASFIKADAATQGNWQSAYGAEGYSIASYTTTNPSYVTPVIQNQETWLWSSGIADPRAVQRTDNPTLGVASAWYSPSNFSIDLNFTDGLVHTVALYVLDYDAKGRTQRVEIRDGNGQLLDGRDMAGYSGGHYLVWTLGGSVKISVINTNPVNAVASALFFGGPVISACDINASGSTTIVDIQQSVNQALEAAPCTGDVNRDGMCDIVDVQRIVNATLGKPCVSP